MDLADGVTVASVAKVREKVDESAQTEKKETEPENPVTTD